MKRAALWLLFVVGCGGKDEDSSTETVSGPVLSHTPTDSDLFEGNELDLTVSAENDTYAMSVVVYWRTTDTEYWDGAQLVEDNQAWSGTIEDLTEPGVDYYFKATDLDTSAVSYLPESGASSPFSVVVLPNSLTLPFIEDFEPEEDETTLYQMDWWTPSDAFDAYTWELSYLDAYSGESSAHHTQSIESVGEVVDWLVSPALDFTEQADGVMVTWMESGSSVSNMETHGLYISTDSRNPADDTYEAVEAELPAPESGEWARSASYDLTEWAGEPVVYLAWLYTGTYADAWTIDDVQVGPLTADLESSISWAPDPVGPGEDATITLSVDNHSTQDASGLSATISFPDGGITAENDTVDLDDIEGMGSGEAIFDVVIDSDVAENQYIAVEGFITDGSNSWDFDGEITIGLPTSGDITITMEEDETVEVIFGVGDPDDPDEAVTAWASTLEAGENSISVDLTDYHASLPPAAGDTRWFAAVTTNGSGTIDECTITWGGESYSATALGKFDEETVGIAYIPEPPDPVLVKTTPTELMPGSESIALSITLSNDGAETSGPVEATVTATDDDLTIVSNSTFEVTSDVWETDEQVSVMGPTIDISADHIDSTPVSLELELDDGTESWTMEVEIEVPWPVLQIIGVEIDDDVDFDDKNGILDEDESADIEITVANYGEMDTSGPLEAVLSVASTSTASATVSEFEGSYDQLTAGSYDDDEFTLTVTSGEAGDTLDLELSLTDDANTYTATTQLVLGEAPWISLGSSSDPTGDVVGEYEWDFTSAQYRVVDGVVELQLTSAVEYDADSLFIESWGYDSPSAGYLYYRWVLQSGSTAMQGYTSSAGFDDIGTLDVIFDSDTQLTFFWDTEEMDLSGDSFILGLAAGWCGPPEYYCDHFPDDWGYPYESFSYSDWMEISW